MRGLQPQTFEKLHGTTQTKGKVVVVYHRDRDRDRDREHDRNVSFYG